MMIWKEEYATGSELIDLQHRRLIENINKLHTLLRGPTPSKAECDQLITFLDHYVHTHFKLEEMCMERHRCPAHAQNQQEHAAFLEVVTEFKHRYKELGVNLELLKSLERTATEWINHHILTVDIQLRGCVGHANQIAVAA